MLKRELLGLVLAPLSPFIVMIFGVVNGKAEYLTDSTYFGISLTFALASYAWAIFFGIPAHLILKRMRRTSLTSYMVVGFLSGFVASFIVAEILLIAGGRNPSALGGLALALAAGALGLVNATVFWFIARPIAR